MNNYPDFIIIGAMKCATTTLHEQLAAQSGIFMSEPKEPNFFSDSPEYEQGIEWYKALFQSADADDLCGESSTHYTKLPTYPQTIERIQSHLPEGMKFIYMMRHPVDRLVSQYIHEWSQCNITVDINQAIYSHPELIQYSQYSMQLKPYLDKFGPQNVLPVFMERFRSHPQEELERICRFIGYSAKPTWVEEITQQHLSNERMKKSAWRDFLVDAPILSLLRRTLVPKGVRTWVRSWWQMKKRPELEPVQQDYLQTIFDEDLSVLGTWLGVELNCQEFKSTVVKEPSEWADLIQLN
ncbi:MAG: sulfotransferase [Leptolyngbyaceae cyanobacterium MO_188.B28]|nr:sulfotransferase [Leptolyngbyaceae cyanobacterium MO_188.B28]